MTDKGDVYGRGNPGGADHAGGDRAGAPDGGALAPVPHAPTEIGELIGRLTADDDMDRETRGRLLGRLARLLAQNARRAGAAGFAGGRLLADRGLSRLLKGDWPRTLEELERRKAGS